MLLLLLGREQMYKHIISNSPGQYVEAVKALYVTLSYLCRQSANANPFLDRIPKVVITSLNSNIRQSRKYMGVTINYFHPYYNDLW